MWNERWMRTDEKYEIVKCKTTKPYVCVIIWCTWSTAWLCVWTCAMNTSLISRCLRFNSSRSLGYVVSVFCIVYCVCSHLFPFKFSSLPWMVGWLWPQSPLSSTYFVRSMLGACCYLPIEEVDRVVCAATATTHCVWCSRSSSSNPSPLTYCNFVSDK